MAVAAGVGWRGPDGSVYLNVNPDTITLEKGFTRDFRKVARAGDLEVTIRTWEDLERAKPLLQTSYEAS